jgi:hypothetical protein
MSKKNLFKLIAIVLVVVGLFLISISFIVRNKNDEKEPDNVVEEKPNDSNKLTYAKVYQMAINLYSGNDIDVAVEEETERFVIKRIYKSTGKTERYYVDKETGIISTDEVVVEG